MLCSQPQRRIIGAIQVAKNSKLALRDIENLITPQRFRRQSTLTSRAHANRNTFHPTFVKT